MDAVGADPVCDVLHRDGCPAAGQAEKKAALTPTKEQHRYYQKVYAFIVRQEGRKING